MVKKKGSEQSIRHAIVLPSYGRMEENLNIISHGIGAFFALIGCIYLLYQAFQLGAWRYWISASVFGIGMILMLSSSTCYHMSKDPIWRKWLRRCDHGVIFLFIAASYTPFTLLALSGMQSIWWTILIWALGSIGILVVFLPIPHKAWIELPLCLGMGWLAMFLYNQFALELGGGARWLLAGGIAYSIGAVLYMIKKLPFNHLIWHIFVLLGVGCHFIAVSNYLMI